MKRVSLLVAIESHTAFASKRGSIRQVAPAQSAQDTTLMIPCTWCNGKHNTMRSSEDHSQASTRLVIWAVMLAWVVTTPLGRPEVPLVYRIMARLSLVTLRPISFPSGFWSVHRSSDLSTRRPRDAAIGDSCGSRKASHTTVFALLSSMKYSSSGPGELSGKG